MKKVIRDGKVAVLYSPGYGAGWSTWNYEYPELMFDPKVVEILESSDFDSRDDFAQRDLNEKIIQYAETAYPDAYFGGVDGLRVEWLPVGTKFLIREFDGSESIELCEEINWIVA